MIPPLPPDNSPSDPADPADPAVTISTTADFGHDPRQCDCAACQHIRRAAAATANELRPAPPDPLLSILAGCWWPTMIYRRRLDGAVFSI